MSRLCLANGILADRAIPAVTFLRQVPEEEDEEEEEEDDKQDVEEEEDGEDEGEGYSE